jgi:hypothetical protein
MSYTITETVVNAIKIIFTDCLPAFTLACEKYGFAPNLHTIVFCKDTWKILRRTSLPLHSDKFQQRGEQFTQADHNKFTAVMSLMAWWKENVKPFIEANIDYELEDIEHCLEMVVPQTKSTPAPAPAPAPAPKPAPAQKRSTPAPSKKRGRPSDPDKPCKKNKTCRSNDPVTNFYNYRSKNIKELAQDPKHDLNENDIEIIIDEFLGYHGWVKGSIDDEHRPVIPMKLFHKAVGAANTCINHCVKQRQFVLGKRTNGQHINKILLEKRQFS